MGVVHSRRFHSVFDSGSRYWMKLCPSYQKIAESLDETHTEKALALGVRHRGPRQK